MAEKTLNSRIIHKHDVEANWLKATNFAPKQGEIIIYDKDASHPYERVKVGDGTTNVNALPFVTDHTHEELELLVEDNLSENIYASGTTSTAFTYDNKQFYYIGTLSESLYENSVVLQLKIKVNDYSSTIRYFTLPYSHSEALYAPYFTTRFTEMGTEAIYLNGADQTLNVQLATDDTNDLYIHHTLSSSIVTVQSVKKILGVVVVEDCIPDTIARVSDIPEQITVDEELSSTSTNPVQNKVVDAAISELNGLVGDTAVSEQISDAISQLTIDWAQNNEATSGYIANRTHWVDNDGTVHKLDEMYLDIISDEDLLLWLVEANVIEPVTSTSGEIYTSNNDEIYVL